MDAPPGMLTEGPGGGAEVEGGGAADEGGGTPVAPMFPMGWQGRKLADIAYKEDHQSILRF